MRAGRNSELGCAGQLTQSSLHFMSKQLMILWAYIVLLELGGLVGFLKAGSDSVNTIVGDVKMMIDLRHPSNEVLDEVEYGFEEFLSSLEAETKGLRTALQRTWENVAVRFDEDARCKMQDADGERRKCSRNGKACL